MPLFEFECKSCGRTEEVLQKFDDPSPICEKDDKLMERVVSVTSPIRKGAGLYSIDTPSVPKLGDWKE